MNNLCATGRIGKDCESRFLSNGDPVTSFTLAIDSGYKEKKITTWLNCSFFGKRGEAVAPYLKKGGQIAVNGELTNRPYTDKSGNERLSLDLRVNDLTLIGSKADSAENKPGKPEQSFEDMEGDIPF